MSRAYSCFIGKFFLGETFVPTRVCLPFLDQFTFAQNTYQASSPTSTPDSNGRKSVTQGEHDLDSDIHPETLQRIERRMSILGLKSWRISAGLDGRTVPGAIAQLSTSPLVYKKCLDVRPFTYKRYKNTSNIVVVKRSDKLHLNHYSLTMTHLIASEVITHSES